MKRITFVAIFLLLIVLASCAQENKTGDEFDLGALVTEADTASLQTTPEEKVETVIVFDGEKAEIDGEGAELDDDGYLYITKGGEYTFSGTFNHGIIVDVTKEHKAELILDGVNIYNKEGAAIYIKSADKAIITLGNGTENSMLDGESYCYDDEAEPSACIYSADDLEIGGAGSLEIYAKCRNGIQSKNDIDIEGGNITVTAPKNAIKGKDSVYICGGNIEIVNCKDGIKSDNEKEEGRGKVTVCGGNIYINCQDDGIQAYRSIDIRDASLEIIAGDDKLNCDKEISVAEGCIKE